MRHGQQRGLAQLQPLARRGALILRAAAIVTTDEGDVLLDMDDAERGIDRIALQRTPLTVSDGHHAVVDRSRFKSAAAQLAQRDFPPQTAALHRTSIDGQDVLIRKT